MQPDRDPPAAIPEPLGRQDPPRGALPRRRAPIPVAPRTALPARRTVPATDVVDPICGMPVDPDSPHRASDATGALVRFCSPYCRAAFRARSRRT